MKRPIAEMIGWFDRQQGSWPGDAHRMRWLRTASQVALDRTETDGTDVVLDLGCGEGVLLSALGGHVRAGLGVDLSPAALALARLHIQDQPNLRVEAGDVREPPLVDGLTTVLAAHVLRYLDPAERQGLFRLLHGRLPPDGLLVIADLIWSLPPEQVDGVDGWLDPTLEYVLAHDELCDDLKRAGFGTRSERLHPAVAVVRALKPGTHR